MMNRTFARLTFAVVSACCALLLTGGCESGGNEGPLLDSNTNWLQACDTAAACGTDFVCVCGVCAPECGSADCSPGEATCALDGVQVHERLCGDDSMAQVCVPNCSADTDCFATQECLEGLCTPRLVDLDAGAADASDAAFDGSGSGACPDEWALYCGGVIDRAPGTLFRCDGGNFTTETTCEQDCIGRPTGDDQCGERCPAGEDFVCGSSLGLPGEELYRCTARGTRFERVCETRCEVRPGNDACAPE